MRIIPKKQSTVERGAGPLPGSPFVDRGLLLLSGSSHTSGTRLTTGFHEERGPVFWLWPVAPAA